MDNLDYDDMRFLIVDNLKPSQDILKRFAMCHTTKQVDSTHYAQDVITICQQKSYDVILLGYDLGEEQKNGQQILEELRVNNYISRHCIIILITAEVSQEMVLAALEHKPDTYLCKPYSLKDLDKRLSSSIKKKKAMAPIYNALDENKPILVIDQCDIALENNTPYKTECLGIKSRQLFHLERYDQAKAIYHAHKNRNNCQWANIGLGKIALQQEEFDDAEDIFRNAITKDPYYLACYDWLAITYQQKLQFLLAEEVLEQALHISPRSLPRLKKYAQLCLKNQNFDKATFAYEQTYKLAHNSIHHSAENAISFAKSLIEYIPSIPMFDAKKMTSKAYKYLHQMNRDFKDAEIRIQSHLLSACLLKQTNENSLSMEELKNSTRLLKKERNNLSDDVIQEIESIFKKLAIPNHEYSELLLVDNSGIDKAQAALEMGITLYKAKEFVKAIAQLSKALKSFPEHLGLKMNLLQVYLVSYEENKYNKSHLKNAKLLLEELIILKWQEPERSRLSKLQSKYQKLKGK
jgi:tetratricopeptide (TPR) repeat protein